MLHVDAVAENKWYGFDVIYYEYGSLVLLYSNPDTAIRVYNILTKANFDDKQLMVLLLPNIQVTVEPFASFFLIRFKAVPDAAGFVLHPPTALHFFRSWCPRGVSTFCRRMSAETMFCQVFP